MRLWINVTSGIIDDDVLADTLTIIIIKSIKHVSEYRAQWIFIQVAIIVSVLIDEWTLYHYSLGQIVLFQRRPKTYFRPNR